MRRRADDEGCAPGLQNRSPTHQLLDVEDGRREEGLNQHLLTTTETRAVKAVLGLAVADDRFHHHLTAAHETTSATRAHMQLKLFPQAGIPPARHRTLRATGAAARLQGAAATRTFGGPIDALAEPRVLIRVTNLMPSRVDGDVAVWQAGEAV